MLALLALAPLAHLRSWTAGIDELVRRASSVGSAPAEPEDLRARLVRESDLDQARLRLAELLLGRELANRAPDLVRGGETLATARELALASLASMPSSSDAWMVLGAATSVMRARARDPRLYSLSREWEGPLERAIELAPGDEAPRRLLAAAYVDVWPAIAPAKRQRIEPMLRRAFLDPPTFERLFATWVGMSRSIEEAESLLPDRPRTWEKLAESAAQRQDAPELARLQRRFRSSIALDFDRLLAEGREAIASGDAAIARSMVTRALTELPIDGEFASPLEQGLALLPPGPAEERLARAAERWLIWATPLCLVRSCPLDEAAMGRLGSLASGALTPSETAFVALAAGDRTRAELLERRSDTLWSEAWAPYLTYKALRLAESHESVEARLALRDVHRAFRRRLSWRLVASQLGLDTAHAEPSPEASRWEANDWWFEHGTQRLDLLPERAATGVLLNFPEPPRQPTLLEPAWDGVPLDSLLLPPGQTSIRLALSVTREAHLFELKARWGWVRLPPRVTLD